MADTRILASQDESVEAIMEGHYKEKQMKVEDIKLITECHYHLGEVAKEFKADLLSVAIDRSDGRDGGKQFSIRLDLKKKSKIAKEKKG